jgi:uncharacterized protein (TIGR02145 family)
MKQKKYLKTFLLIFLPIFFVNFLVIVFAQLPDPLVPPKELSETFLHIGSVTQFKEGALGVGGVFEALGVKISSGSTSQPTCNASTRSMMWVIEETGDNNDEVVFCLRAGDDSYDWYPVTSSHFSCGDDFTDPRDSQVYPTVEIGTQCWMAKNLNYSGHTVGTSWCYDDTPSNCDTYGRLYNWAATMDGDSGESSQGVCPVGWHVPSDAEQHTLDSYLSTGTCDPNRSAAWDCNPAGTKLKTSSWGGDNSSGFSALAGGGRFLGGTFNNLGTDAFFWSSSPSSGSALFRDLSSPEARVFRYAFAQAYGFSVRCLRD